MSDHASHFMRNADGDLVHVPYFGCPPCTEAVALNRAAADMAVRDDLAREVAREWAAVQPAIREYQQDCPDYIGVPGDLRPLLDRLAAAHGVDQ